MLIEKELPDYLIENYKLMELSSEKNKLKVLANIEEKLDYLEKLERFYGRTSKEHINYMILRDYEGSVEERLWYNIARSLMK